MPQTRRNLPLLARQDRNNLMQQIPAGPSRRPAEKIDATGTTAVHAVVMPSRNLTGKRTRSRMAHDYEVVTHVTFKPR